MKNNFPVHYSVTCKNPEAHIFEISCNITSPNPGGQIISMANWIPGSYMIRDFSKNIIEITANNDTEKLTLQKLNKNSWKCQQSVTSINITYTVYAFDLSVRSAHLDSSHAFFNGTSLFVKVHGQENSACSVDLIEPDNTKYKNWTVATTLPIHSSKIYEFGLYQASNYDELIDHPVEMGDFSVIPFTVQNITHEMVISGRFKTNKEKLAEQLTKICNTHIQLFGELPDLQRYLFLTTVLSNGYGGLEHRSSTSLVCSRKDLVNTNNNPSKHYRQFLALCSHEYFHTWNIKRIKPSAFLPYNLDCEVYTQQLWFFEGVTSYYDELALTRSAVISPDSYLELLSQTITRVWRQYGRFTQSVADSSFDAWTKFYKQDENATNAIVSYYAKGTLIALSLDLTIRNKTNNKMSLDNIMKYLWLEYGKKNIGLNEGELETIICQQTNIDFTDFFDLYLHGTNDLPLKELFLHAGVDIQFRHSESQSDLGGNQVDTNKLNKVALGIKTKCSNNRVIIQNIVNNSSAQLAGLSAGDELVSLDGLKVTDTNLNNLLQAYDTGDEVKIYVFRRDELFNFNVTLQQAPLDTCVLSFLKSTTDDQKLFCNEWLHIKN